MDIHPKWHKWIKVGGAVMVGFVGGYFCPDGPLEQASEALIRSETGIDLDFSEIMGTKPQKVTPLQLPHSDTKI